MSPRKIHMELSKSAFPLNFCVIVFVVTISLSFFGNLFSESAENTSSPNLWSLADDQPKPNLNILQDKTDPFPKAFEGDEDTTVEQIEIDPQPERYDRVIPSVALQKNPRPQRQHSKASDTTMNRNHLAKSKVSALSQVIYGLKTQEDLQVRQLSKLNLEEKEKRILDFGDDEWEKDLPRLHSPRDITRAIPGKVSVYTQPTSKKRENINFEELGILGTGGKENNPRQDDKTPVNAVGNPCVTAPAYTSQVDDSAVKCSVRQHLTATKRAHIQRPSKKPKVGLFGPHSTK